MTNLVDQKIIEREYRERLQYERQRYETEAQHAPHLQPEPSRLAKGVSQALAALGQKLTVNLQTPAAKPTA